MLMLVKFCLNTRGWFNAAETGVKEGGIALGKKEA